MIAAVGRAAVALAAIATLACGGKAAPPPAAPAAQVAPPSEPVPAAPPAERDALPTIPATPQPAPDALLATATVGDALGWLGDLVTYADAVRPGVGAVLRPNALLGQLAAYGLDLRGADLSRPIRLLALDPTQYAMPVVAVVAVTDETMLRSAAEQLGLAIVVHHAWAAVGARDALRAAAPYALTTAVTTVVPRELTVTVDLATIITRFRPLAEQWLAYAAQSGALTGGATTLAQARSMIDVLEQFERAELSLAAERDRIAVTTTLTARAGESFARFVAAQRPATFALLERVAGAPMVLGGRVDYRDVFAAMMDHWVKTNVAKYGATITAAWTGVFAEWPSWMSGEHVLAIRARAGGVNIEALWDTADGAKVEAAVSEWLHAMVRAADPGAVKPARGTYRGVRHTAIRLAEVAAKQGGFDGVLYLAAPGATFAVTGGSDGVAGMRGLIDAVKPPKGRKPAAVPGLATVIAAARARGDSYLIAMDLPAVRAIKEPGVTVPPSREHAALAIGFGGGAVVLRATLPATQLAPLIP